MQLLDRRADLDTFFKKLSRVRECALLLDYDGTLAPFRIERDRAFPYPGVQEVLTGIAALGNTRLVIVTGRPAKEVTRLLGGSDGRPEIWGCHGWERLLPDGRYQIVQAEEWARQSLALAYRSLLAFVRSKLRPMFAIDRYVERKPVGLALHWRGCPPRAITVIRDGVGGAWAELARYTGLKLCEFEEGVELRVPGRTKADAIEAVLKETDEEAPVAYLGDGLTDEDAFQALKRKGLTALVRPEVRPTAADVWMQPPYELREFLGLWKYLRSGPRLKTSGSWAGVWRSLPSV